MSLGGIVNQIADVLGEAAGRTERQRSPEEQAAHESNLIRDLEEQWVRADQAMHDKFRRWRENVAFLEGIQWFRSTERGLVNTQNSVRGDDRLRLVDNRLFDHARRLHARLTQMLFDPTVSADTGDPGDRKAARGATAALRNFVKRTKVARIRRRIGWWIVACGVAYLEPYWDPDAGPYKPVPVLDEAKNPIMEDALDDQGNPIVDEIPGGPDPISGLPGAPIRRTRRRPKMELQPLGEAGLADRSPFQVRPDPRTADWHAVRWVFVDEEAAREDVIDRFAHLVEDKDLDALLPKEGRKTQMAPWIPDVPLAGAPTQDLTGLPKAPPAVSGVITVRRYYEVPSRKYPEGRRVLYIPDPQVLLYEGPLGGRTGRLPLKQVKYLERPWDIDGFAPAEFGKIIQRVFNRVISRYGEHLLRLAAGWLLVPTTSGIPKRGFTSAIGSVIRYMPAGGKPDWVFPPFQGLAWYDRFLVRLEASMEERMALPPAMRGQMPRGARAARTLELLKEAADEIQIPVLAENADAWIETYEDVLDIMQERYTVARLVSMLGPGKTAEIIEFKGEMIPVDWRDRLTVHVEAGESLPSSRIARMELVLTLAREHGAFGEIGSPAYIRRLNAALELDAGFLATEEDLDVTIAEEENLLLFAGGTLDEAPRLIDDDEVHIREHLTFIKQQIAAGRAARLRPLMQHVDAHRMQATQKLAATPPPTQLVPSQSSAPETGGGEILGAEPEESAAPTPPVAAAP